MHIARSSPYGGGGLYGGGLPDRPSQTDSPSPQAESPTGQRPPWTDTPPPERTWDQADTPLPRRNMGPGSQTGRDIIQRLPPPHHGQNPHACENIPLPQTSLAPPLRVGPDLYEKFWIRLLSRN